MRLEKQRRAAAISPASGDTLNSLLSFCQRRLWLGDRIGERATLMRSVRLRGPLDRVALRRALDGIVTRHEVLRTVYREGEPGSEPVPVVASLELDPVAPSDDSPDVPSGIVVTVVGATVVPVVTEVSSAAVVLEPPEPVVVPPATGLQPRLKLSTARRSEDAIRPW